MSFVSGSDRIIMISTFVTAEVDQLKTLSSYN
jgi:hypothetical protein